LYKQQIKKLNTMKTALISSFMLAMIVVSVSQTFGSIATEKEKKVHSFLVAKEFDIPAKNIWAVVGEDYGAIANSHPRIVQSEYINGSLKAEEGAERVCNFNDEGTQYLHERMLNYDPANMQFTNQVFHAGKFPVDPDYTRALYKVEDLGNGRSRLTFDMQFRTKPAMMGMMMKGRFQKLIEDYFIAIEHHAKTGEKVTQENFKEIKKQYS